MTDIVVFPDVTAMAMAYVASHFPDVQTGLIADADWDWSATLVTISDTGGTGGYETAWGAVYSEAVITIDVSNPDAEVASDLARSMHALFMVWSSIEDSVSRVVSITKPVYYPNTDPYTPSYEMTFAVTVEGTEKTI